MRSNRRFFGTSKLVPVSDCYKTGSCNTSFLYSLPYSLFPIVPCFTASLLLLLHLLEVDEGDGGLGRLLGALD